MLSDSDLAKKVLASAQELKSELGKLVHPISMADMKGAEFPQYPDLDYTPVVYTANVLDAKTGTLTIMSPVKGEIVFLHPQGGSPSLGYNFQILPDGADYFVWVNFFFPGASASKPQTIRSMPDVKQGSKVERGQPIAVCSSACGDTNVAMGTARCKQGLVLGTTDCATVRNIIYLNPRDPQWWVGGAPKFIK